MAVAAMAFAATATSCVHAVNSASLDQQVNRILTSAYQQMLRAGSANATMRIEVASGADVFTSAQGSVSFQFASGHGSARLVIQPAGTLDVLRTPGSIFLRPGEAKSVGTTGSWINFKLDTQHPRLSSLPEILTPGVDPYQLFVLLRGILCARCVTAEAPAVVSGSSGNYTEYVVTLATAKVAGYADRSDAGWLGQMATEPGGGEITLAATIRHGRISSISGTLPVPDPNSGPAAVTQTASAVLQFAYGQHSAAITFPVPDQVTGAPS